MLFCFLCPTGMNTFSSQNQARPMPAVTKWPTTFLDGLSWMQKHFYREMRKLENHRFTCDEGPNGYFKLISSTAKCFVWNLKFKCPLCGECRTISSDPAADNPSALTIICDSVVWGTMSVGGGHANMEELFATVGVRSIDQKTFAKKENELGQVRTNEEISKRKFNLTATFSPPQWYFCSPFTQSWNAKISAAPSPLTIFGEPSSPSFT